MDRKIIDGHIHLYRWFCKDGTHYFDALDEMQRETGSEAFCIASLTDKTYGGVDINIMSALYKEHNKTAYAYWDFVYPFYPLTPDVPEGMDALAQYREMMDIGFDGIKILYKPDVQKYIELPINHPFFDPMYEQAEKDNTHFIWHVADPRFFWNSDYKGAWSYKDCTYPTYDYLMETTLDVLKRFPKLNVTFAHFMFLSDNPKVLEEIFETYENVSVDITPGIEMYVSFNKNHSYYKSFFEKYAHRIYFGTDLEPERADIHTYHREIADVFRKSGNVSLAGLDVQGFGLTDEALNKIFYENFSLGGTRKPKQINKEALKEYVDKYKHLITNQVNKDEILKHFA